MSYTVANKVLKTLENAYAEDYPTRMSLPRTQEALERITLEIPKHCGDLTATCRALGILPAHLHMWIASDPEAAKAVHTAQQIGYTGIESAAIQRAVKGVEKAVYYKGDIVGYQTEYSDGLMNTILKARVPGYNPEQVHMHSHMVNVQLMPRANSYEEWQEQRQKALNPPDTHDAEYTEVPEPGVTGDSGAEGLRDVL